MSADPARRDRIAETLRDTLQEGDGSVRVGRLHEAVTRLYSRDVLRVEVLQALHNDPGTFDSPGRGWWRLVGQAPAPPPTAIVHAAPRTTELGATGTPVFGGLLGDVDYNPDLRGTALYDVVDKMRKSDGNVRAGLAAIMLPIESANWSIQPASDSARDRQIADAIAGDLFGGMTMSWEDTLRQVLLMLAYGSIPFEKVWRMGSDGRVHLHKLAPRLPRTITEWQVDAHGGLVGIQQTANSAEPVTIPVAKLLVFVHQQEGSDFRGVSILRAAYKHWWIVEKLYVIDAIGVEKRNMGVDVGTMKGVSDPDRRKQIERALMTLHAHEKSYVTEHEDEFAYRIEGITGTVLPALPSIEHHTQMILRSMMVEFIALGSSGAGSFAMHKDKSSLFLMAIKGIAKIITQTVNKYLIPQWVGFNWQGVEALPRLVHSRLDTRDAAAIANSISQLVNSGAIVPDKGVEDTSRDLLELPARKGDEPPPGPPGPAGGLSLQGPDHPAEGGPSCRMRGETFEACVARKVPALLKDGTAKDDTQAVAIARSMCGKSCTSRRGDLKRRHPVERFVEFEALAGGMTDTRDTIAAAAKAYQTHLVESAIRHVEGAFRTGSYDDLAPGRFKVPTPASVEKKVAHALGGLVELGRREVKAELQRQGAPDERIEGTRRRYAINEPLDPDRKRATGRFLRARAQAFMAVVAARVVNAASTAGLDAATTGTLKGAGFRKTMHGLSDAILAGEAGKLVSQALNLGRKKEQRELADLAENAIYSALLDSDTCDPCESIDGETFAVDSARYDEHYPPLRGGDAGPCDGRGNCRCMMILVLKPEQPATA